MHQTTLWSAMAFDHCMVSDSSMPYRSCEWWWHDYCWQCH